MKTDVKGLLTNYGWAYECTNCDWGTAIMSDNIMPSKCPDCGSEIDDMGAGEAKQRGFRIN